MSTLHRLSRTTCIAALGSLALSGTGRAQLSLTAFGAASGFTLSPFATGFPFPAGAAGPLGILFRSDGTVLVSDYNGDMRLFPFDTPLSGPAQSAASAPITAPHLFGNACGIANVASGTYMVQQTLGTVVKISDLGAILASIASIPHATGICGFPSGASAPGTMGLAGHLFVSTAGGPADSNKIWEVDPALPFASAASVFIADPADGLCFTSSGAYLLAAAGPGMRMYDSITKAVAFEATVAGSDGIAVGTGTLEGKAYVNCTDGKVWEIVYDALPGLGPEVDPPITGGVNPICENGTRGDFIAMDRIVASGGPSGPFFPSLLLTQSSTIERLDPPGGGFFGPPDSIVGLLDDCDGNGQNDAAEILASPYKDLDFDGRLDVCESLSADKASLSILTGGTQNLSIHPGSWFFGQLYLTLGTISGVTPGLTVDGVLVPLNVDFYTLYTLNSPNSAALPGTIGLLSGAGEGSCGFAIGPGAPAGLLGLGLDHATVFFDLPIPAITGATNTIHLTFTL